MLPSNETSLNEKDENYDYLVEQVLFVKLGSFNWSVDQTFLFFLIPFAIIGVLLNVATLIGLERIKSGKYLIYKYMQVYTVVSLLICVSTFLLCLQHVPRYWAFSYSYVARIFTCYMGLIFNNTIFFFGNVLNIFIILERLVKTNLLYSFF